MPLPSAPFALLAFEPERDLQALAELWVEYLTWGNAELERDCGQRHSEAEPAVAEDLAHLDVYAPPRGCLLLAHGPNGPLGSIALRDSGAGFAEVKRLYVRPAARGLGLGQALVSAALAAASAAGYSEVRLDSARFMAPAHALYRRHGFDFIAPYPEAGIPQTLWPHWVFMGRRLEPSAPSTA